MGLASKMVIYKVELPGGNGSIVRHPAAALQPALTALLQYL
jgi:hypothetical protein